MLNATAMAGCVGGPLGCSQWADALSLLVPSSPSPDSMALSSPRLGLSVVGVGQRQRTGLHPAAQTGPSNILQPGLQPECPGPARPQNHCFSFFFSFSKKTCLGSSRCGSAVTNLTSIHEEVGLIPGLAQ